MKITLAIILVLGILTVAGFVAASFLPGSVETIPTSAEESSCGCGLSGGCGCGGSCTAEKNCGLSSCGTVSGESCGCRNK